MAVHGQGVFLTLNGRVVILGSSMCPQGVFVALNVA